MRTPHILGMALSALAPVLGAGVLAAGQGDPAQAILAKVREAIGGESKLAKVKSVSAEGSFRQVSGQSERNGDLELFLVVPDKYQRIEQGTMPTGMPGPRFATTLNGAEGWMGPLGPMPAGMVMRFPGQGGPGGGPGSPGQGRGADGPGGQNRRFDPTARVRAEFYRVALMLLPGSAVTQPLTFTHAGTAEAPDGKAEVLDVKGPDNFAARLFVDANTHLPLMLTYVDRDPTQIGRVRTFQARPGETDDQRRQRIEEERKKREAEGPPQPPPLVEITMFVADHQEVDGVQLPRSLTLQMGETPVQEWRLEKIKVNAPIDVEQFKRKTSN